MAEFVLILRAGARCRRPPLDGLVACVLGGLEVWRLAGLMVWVLSGSVAPGGLWGLALLGGMWVAPGGRLGRSWVLLGRSWLVLGTLWGALGTLLGVLGRP